MNPHGHSVTAVAPINIALIKYWGKADESEMLPCNESLSMTISSPKLLTTTQLTADPDLVSDTFVLNSKERPMTLRMTKCIGKARELCMSSRKSPRVDPNWKLRIVSHNSVPTGSGLASSASGFAALARALIELYGLEETADLAELSVIARMGSGSACRSMLDGFVLWKRVMRSGKQNDWDSTIAQVMSHREWPQLQGLVVLFSVAEKAVSSSEGMQRTVRTSALFETRVSSIVPQHLSSIVAALAEKDFARLAEVMMRDSNNFHACCLDSFPPIGYLSSDSWIAMDIVHRINEQAGRIVLGYTFDAGPNPVVLAAEDASLLSFKNELKRRLSLSGRPEVETIPFRIGNGAQITSDAEIEG